MATYIVNEVRNDKDELVIHVYTHSACCKDHLFFIEDRPGHFIFADSRLDIDEGMKTTIINCRRHKMFWPEKGK